MKNSPPKKTRLQLERENMELRAQLVHNYHFADAELSRLSRDKMTGSSVIVQLSSLGGKAIDPFALRDGLSDELVEALRKDIARSYDHSIVFKPSLVAR